MQLQQITIAAPSPLAKRPVTLRRGKEECARPAPAKIGKILGARQGILGDDYVYLRKPSAKKLKAIAATPSSALGSCRKKPDADDCRRIFEAFRKKGVGYFFYIGGNDSADAARSSRAARRTATATCRCRARTRSATISRRS